MGIRMTQVVGLKLEAETWLDANGIQVPTSFCPHCNGVLSTGLQSEVYGHCPGMFDDGPALRTYQLKDGKTVREVEQCSPWSSGPVIFLCLEDENGVRMFEWSELEIKLHM